MFAEQGKCTVKSTKVTRGSSRYILVIFTRFSNNAKYKFDKPVKLVYTQDGQMRYRVKENLRKQVFNHEQAYWQLKNSINIAPPIAGDKMSTVIERLETGCSRALTDANHHSLKEITESIESLHELYKLDKKAGDTIKDTKEFVPSLNFENMAFMSCLEAWKFVCPDSEARKKFDYQKHGGERHCLQFIQS